RVMSAINPDAVRYVADAIATSAVDVVVPVEVDDDDTTPAAAVAAGALRGVQAGCRDFIGDVRVQGILLDIRKQVREPAAEDEPFVVFRVPGVDVLRAINAEIRWHVLMHVVVMVDGDA